MEELQSGFKKLSLEKKPKKKTNNIKNVNCSTVESSNTDSKIIKIGYVLEPCSFLDIINIDTLKKYISKDIDGNKEYFDDRNITYKLSDPKKAEWILHKSIENSELVGDGNKNIDIILKHKKIGIDVSVLSLTKNMTNEKSVIQNFTTGNELDNLFLNNKGSEVVEIFKNKMIEKYKSVDNENINILYYVIFVCNKQNIYLTCLKANCKNIINMSFQEFTKTSKSAIIHNFIDMKYGETKLYKSKKRIELRLNKNMIDEFCSVKLY
jgi:hypothetical protein